jgi:hypothetical protein
MWIEGHDHGRASRFRGIADGGSDHRLMAPMHSVEDADREENRSRDLS